MSFGGNEQTSQSQGKTYLDPVQTGLVDTNAQNVAAAAAPGGALAYTPYSGPGLSFGDPSTLQSLTGYTPQQITAPDVSGYMNPYIGDVVNTTNANLQRQGQIQQTIDAGNATQAGAFGGSRSAVLQNLDNESTQRAIASADANLNQQGYGQALQAAQTGQLANQQADLQAAQTKLQALGISEQQAEALFGANWATYLNSQQDPQAVQQLVNQAYGIIPTGPLSTQSSSSQGVGMQFGLGAK